MKLCRFTDRDTFAPRYGIVEGDVVRPLMDEDAFGISPRASTDNIPLDDVRILAPVRLKMFASVGIYLDTQ